MMNRTSFSAAVLSAGLLLAAPAFAQTGTTTGNGHAMPSTTATKQHTQSDPTSQYNFAPGSGSYAPRSQYSAQKQRTDGEDVTGNRNFPAGSK